MSWSENDIHKLLEKFWLIEDIPTHNELSKDDRACEENFKLNTTISGGRYKVKLPIRDESLKLGDSLPSATSRMLNMERRFSINTKLRDEYIHFMREYDQLGHVRLLRSDEEITGNSIFYLPHHAVIKQTSSTTRVRVVFDGSAKSSKNLSLNDNLMTGPTIQRDIFSIILRFRRHAVAFSSDIEKMYRQVEVSEKHQNYQRIVWRENPDEKMKHYCLKTVTYGLACSAFLAIRSLHQVAVENSKEYPQASDVILSDFYVDDLLSGANTVQSAMKLKNELCGILGERGFHLRKWSSNSVEFMKSLPIEIRGEEVISIEDPSNATKTLGINWITSQDIFTFSCPEFNDTENTKRALLANTSKIFDPLGWLSPITIRLKILLQSLWPLKIEWDEALPADIIKTWRAYKDDLSNMDKITIPRRFVGGRITKAVEYHGFCDASELAYAAVIYARTTDEENNIHIHLLTAKTKVAPLKQISLPRLELCGALLLAKLFKSLCDALEVEDTDNIHAWSDSNIVLSWLSAVPRKWNCFVANRTSRILDVISADKWRHVSSSTNPADLPSRGTSTINLLAEMSWWNGPAWLIQSKDHWPNQPKVPPTNAEERLTCLHTEIEEEDNSTLNVLFERVSNFKKALRILAQCYRFRDGCHGVKSNYPTAMHHKKAKEICLKWAQTTYFRDDKIRLDRNQQLSRRSKLISLNPFIDSSGIIRVGGRLSFSSLTYSSKFPIILPQSHPVTKSLILSLHQQYLHPTLSTLLYICRLEYWIIGAKQLIKKITSSCPRCYRTRLATTNQLMGQLPAPRVLPSKPFLNVGIDYAGPIIISSRKGRGAKKIKAYICLFICMATKAIHLELVSDMTTTAFIATFHRFISRRGLPKNLYSDNGSNFVGAKRKLNELHHIMEKNYQDERIIAELNNLEINWHMIPPSAPHFGGLWEAGIKSTKNYIKKVIGDNAITFEEMATLLCQIEAILNSRPLVPLNDDPNDLEILTPGHFLISCTPTSLPHNTQDDDTMFQKSLAISSEHG